MITKDQMIPCLVAVHPAFDATWQQFCAEWRDEATTATDGLPIYSVLSDLSRHLIELLERGDDAALRAVFEVVKSWHVDGEHYVREAATIGLLEDLQKPSFHSTTKPEQFERFLGTESAKGWRNLYRFWGDGPDR